MSSLNALNAFEPVRAADIPLEHEPVPESQRADGHPGTAHSLLTAFDGAEIGVWEMTEGAMLDVEADEVFVVISGAATVTLLEGDGDGAASVIALGPGSICRLEAGMRTRWDVTEALRKVYVTDTATREG